MHTKSSSSDINPGDNSRGQLCPFGGSFLCFPPSIFFRPHFSNCQRPLCPLFFSAAAPSEVKTKKPTGAEGTKQTACFSKKKGAEEEMLRQNIEEILQILPGINDLAAGGKHICFKSLICGDPVVDVSLGEGLS